MVCPVALQAEDGLALVKARTENVSEGGAYLIIARGDLPVAVLPEQVDVTLAIPRTTPNTYLLEQFTAHASIIRTDKDSGTGSAGVALRFQGTDGPDLHI